MSVTTAILQILFNAQPARLNETVLLAEVRLTRGACGESEFRAGLQQLRAADMAGVTKDALSQDNLWEIKPAGVARITGGAA